MYELRRFRCKACYTLFNNANEDKPWFKYIGHYSSQGTPNLTEKGKFQDYYAAPQGSF